MRVAVFRVKFMFPAVKQIYIFASNESRCGKMFPLVIQEGECVDRCFLGSVTRVGLLIAPESLRRQIVNNTRSFDEIYVDEVALY
jgi:hypothetical protein